MKHIVWFLFSTTSSCAFAANPPSILNNSSHAVESADAGLVALNIPHTISAGPSSSTLAINQTCSGGCTEFLGALQIIGDARNTSKTEFAALSTTIVTPSVPYQVISQSSTGYTLTGFEQANYASLVAGGIVYSMAYCGTPEIFDYPPITFVTVLPNNSAATPVGGTGCGYAQGIEFSIPVNSGSCLPSSCTWTPISGGLSLNVSSPSATTAVMSSVLAALKVNHPLWTWGDVKSVLRTTASNWPTGYTAFNANGPAYGYGNINYVAANSYVGSVYLQPPGFVVKKNGANATFTLYPFVTSRRAGEVVYSFLKRPSLPNPGTTNEYSYAQISALLSAHNGELVYNSNGAGGIQSVSYVPPTKATRYFVAFTVDNTSNLAAAKFSRAEEYLVKRANFGYVATTQVIINSLLD
jgi:hypothetical protein